jgi:hypothetical protein
MNNVRAGGETGNRWGQVIGDQWEPVKTNKTVGTERAALREPAKQLSQRRPHYRRSNPLITS